MRIMRITRNSLQSPIMFLGFFAVAARVGFISSVLIIFMHRFEITALNVAVLSIVLQGSITIMRRSNEWIHNRVSLIFAQRLGSLVGVFTSLMLVLISNIFVFFIFALIASFSKVLIDGTFPKVAHKFLLEDDGFSSKFMGSQKGSIVLICLLIAPFSMTGSVVIPMLISSVFYMMVYAVTLLHPECASSKQALTTQQNVNEVQKSENESVTSTLLSVDLIVNIIGSGSCVLMPLCFMHISKLSQGIEPIFTLFFGLFCGLAGLVFIPMIKKKLVFSQKMEWMTILWVFPIAITAQILFSTYAGAKIGFISACIDGIALTILASLVHEIGARNLSQNRYQQFGCVLEQRNAIARVVTPLIIGSIASILSLAAAFYLLCLIGLFGSVFIMSRVLVIIRAEASEHNKIQTAELSKILINRKYVGI